MMSDYSPSPAKAKPKAKPKVAKAKEDTNMQDQQQQPGAAGKSIEEIYQKKSQLEHILLRPDTYVGSTEKQQQTLWVVEEGRMVNKAITFVPGLYKIFDEILVNAADNKARDGSMDMLRVDIDAVRATRSLP